MTAGAMRIMRSFDVIGHHHPSKSILSNFVQCKNHAFHGFVSSSKTSFDHSHLVNYAIRLMNTRSYKTYHKNRKDRGQSTYKFVDRARIRTTGGGGGKGCVSFEHVGSYKKVPNGGHGGAGGSVVVVADKNVQSLNLSQHHFAAESGAHGSSSEMHGKRGDNYVLKVPCGVIVKRILDFDEVWDEKEKKVVSLQDVDDNDDDLGLWNEDDVEYGQHENEVVLTDLDLPNSHIVVAYGGKGGIGNCTVNGRNYDADYAANAAKRAVPEIGESAFLELELKLIADIGFVGFPNAGKSSILAAMSRADPAIAPYPFTTLHPLVGCIEYRDGFRILAADVPGLIEGASVGRGRGFDFLRHVERTKALMYMVDAAGVDGRCPIHDFKILVSELAEYGEGHLLKRPALIVANKLDLLQNKEESEELSFKLQEVAEDYDISYNDNVLGISVKTGEGLKELSKAMRETVEIVEKFREDEIKESRGSHQ